MQYRTVCRTMCALTTGTIVRDMSRCRSCSRVLKPEISVVQTCSPGADVAYGVAADVAWPQWLLCGFGAHLPTALLDRSGQLGDLKCRAAVFLDRLHQPRNQLVGQPLEECDDR